MLSGITSAPDLTIFFVHVFEGYCSVEANTLMDLILESRCSLSLSVSCFSHIFLPRPALFTQVLELSPQVARNFAATLSQLVQ